eukprot:6214284-Pleurochrysis_carterae.AAC.4
MGGVSRQALRRGRVEWPRATLVKGESRSRRRYRRNWGGVRRWKIRVCHVLGRTTVEAREIREVGVCVVLTGSVDNAEIQRWEKVCTAVLCMHTPSSCMHASTQGPRTLLVSFEGEPQLHALKFDGTPPEIHGEELGEPLLKAAWLACVFDLDSIDSCICMDLPPTLRSVQILIPVARRPYL